MAAGVEKSGSDSDFRHPIFDPIRPWIEKAGDFSLESLNRLAEESGLKTEGGRPVRFVPPSSSDTYYEVHVFETGHVQTRPDNLHDRFNALAWLAFPKTKARINAMHAAEIPREGGKRGRLRDMLTIFDEGGAIVSGDSSIELLVRNARWQDLFLRRHQDFRITVVGHAVLEQALAPHPRITCKVVFADPSRDLDAQAADALASCASPKELAPLPVFGYPGWIEGNEQPGFHSDARYFRPARTTDSRSRAVQD